MRCPDSDTLPSDSPNGRRTLYLFTTRPPLNSITCVYVCIKCRCCFQNYVNAHPELVVLDPVENVRKLLDRHTQYKMATKANSKANQLSMEDGQCTLHPLCMSFVFPLRFIAAESLLNYLKICV